MRRETPFRHCVPFLRGVLLCYNTVMVEKKRFDFEAFDDVVREALEQNDIAMAQLSIRGVAQIRRPGEIGGVLAVPREFVEPEPPEAA